MLLNKEDPNTFYIVPRLSRSPVGLPQMYLSRLANMLFGLKLLYFVFFMILNIFSKFMNFLCLKVVSSEMDLAESGINL